MYQDTVSLLQPTVFVLRVCGVLPSALRRLHLPLSTKIYSMFLATFLIFPVAIIIQNSSIYRGYVLFVISVIFTCDVLRHSVLIICAITSSESLVKFFRIMESVQRSLYSLNIRQPPNPTKRSQIVWVLVLLTPKLLSNFFQSLSMGLVGISYIFHALVVSGTACKIRVLFDLVHHKLELLNWHLDDLNNRWPVFLPRPPDVSFRQLSCVREWRRTKFINENDDNRVVTAEKIRYFNKAHLKLVFALKTLNSAFSTTFIAYTIPAVLNAVACLCMGLNLKLISWDIYDFFCYIIGEVTALGAILSLSTKIEKEVTRTALLVHDLLDETHHSSEVIRELEQFSMSLLHRKATFTAGGFFDFNLKLLARIAGVMAPIALFLSQTVGKALNAKNNE